MAEISSWWKGLRPTQRRRLLLIMLVPLIGLTVTGYQLGQALFGSPQIHTYDITPSATLAPTIEPSLFDISDADKPLITDDIFFGLHKQIDADLPWIETLDVTEARKHGPAVWPQIENVRQLLGNPASVEATLQTVNVRQTGAESGEVGVAISYKLASGDRVPISYTLTYQITRTAPSSQGSITYTFQLVGLQSEGQGLSSSNTGAGTDPSGQEIIN